MVRSYLRQRRGVLLTFLLFGGLFAVTFALYSLPVQAVAYPFLLCAVAGSILLAADYRQALRRHRQMERVLRLPDEIAASLPPADTVEREDYRQLVALLEESRRRLRLEYQPLDHTVVTDGKWLGFVVEQVLSNALKYTASGSVTIAMDGDDLCIRDTGMGIAAEDLPRIFEQGFTGVNGRRDRRASGIGLYLCRRICGNLGHTIRASSVPNQGTEIRIGLGQKKTLPE